MTDSWEEVGEIVSITSSDLEPACPGFAIFGTLLFLKKMRKIYCYLRDNHGNIKLIRVLDRIL